MDKETGRFYATPYQISTAIQTLISLGAQLHPIAQELRALATGLGDLVQPRKAGIAGRVLFDPRSRDLGFVVLHANDHPAPQRARRNAPKDVFGGMLDGSMGDRVFDQLRPHG